jgi:hypothetical protein
MLRFRLHQLQLGRWSHTLLPKLNEKQVSSLSDRLAKKGFKVRGTSTLIAETRAMTIHINPSGHCWSSSDVGDSIVPIIPMILDIPKQGVPLEELLSHYFRVMESGDSAVVRTATRMESGNDWKALRASGRCALTPDERAVISMVIENSGSCTLMTDFPVKASQVRVMGNRRYFMSVLGPRQAAATLREVGGKGTRNSYLPGGGLLLLDSFRLPSLPRQREVLEGLGEWSYFTPN